MEGNGGCVVYVLVRVQSKQPQRVEIDKMCLILKEILFLTIFDSNINATSVDTMINMDYNHQRSRSEVSLYFEHRPKTQSSKLCNNKTTKTTITILISFEVQF